MKGNNNRRREFNFTDNELLKMMTELRITHTVNVDQLKQAFFQQIKAHHSDKGGDVERAKNITQAYRVLKQYLESGILLPAPRNGPSKPQPQQPSASAPSRSGCRPNRQGQQAAPDGFEDFGDFQETKKRRRKKGQGGGDAENNQQENGGESSNGGEGTSNGTNGTTKSQHKFVNGYIYATEDYSTYDDPMERPDRQKDGVRKIRGGLMLYQDFQRSQNLPQEYQELGTTFTEDDLVDNPIFEPILAKIRDATDDLHAFAEKLRTFVYISWALDGGSPHDQRILIQRVKIHKVVVEDDSLYEITVPAKNFDEDVLTPGLHVEVTSDSDTRLWASAVIEQVRVDSQSIVVFFMDPLRISRILNLSNTVNVAINCSAFVYRSQLRSIEYVEKPKHTRDMSQVFFPKPEFTETFPEFAERRQREVEAMPFREEADHNYNEEQKNAIYSIVQKANNPWPFILFGPPGTGKTITLIEAIRHLVMQSDQNRILVCTPSKMAADNFAEALLAHNFLDNKYIFRMHSLSTMAKKRNKKLDPISYLAKEAKYRFFGIPDRLNLKMFRVIISTLATSSYLISAGGLRGYFTHLIFDEAGQALESEIWITIGGLVGPQTSVCLAGDPMQLGPVLNVKTMKYFGFDNSMLKRIITSDPYREQQVDDRAYLILRQTYRSHPKILRPCSYLFYDNMLVVDDSHDDFHKYSEWTGLPTKGFPIIFHSSRGSRDEQSPNKSFHNDFEADLVARYVEQLLRETPTLEKDVGIISPYKNQVIRLRHRLAMHPGITVDSVEGFQGSERDVIIISTVRQLDMGFLRCDLRLNTSISRAKFLLIVFGNEHLLSQHTTWKKFIFYCQFHGGFLNESGEKMLPIAVEEVVQDREAEQYMQNIQNGSGAGGGRRVDNNDDDDDVATGRTESEYYEAEEEPPGEDNDSW